MFNLLEGVKKIIELKSTCPHCYASDTDELVVELKKERAKIQDDKELVALITDSLRLANDLFEAVLETATAFNQEDFVGATLGADGVVNKCNDIIGDGAKNMLKNAKSLWKKYGKEADKRGQKFI